MKKQKEYMFNGEAECMRRLMQEAKVKDPDHMCGGAFMNWAWETGLKWYDTAGCWEEHQAKKNFKTAYKAWVAAWKQAKEIDWEDVARINRPIVKNESESLKRENAELKAKVKQANCDHPWGYKPTDRSDYTGNWIQKCPVCGDEIQPYTS